MGQEIVYVPASRCIDAFRYPDVAVYPLEAAAASRRSCVRIVPSGKVYSTQRPNHDLLCPRQRKYKSINSRLISMRLHAIELWITFI